MKHLIALMVMLTVLALPVVGMAEVSQDPQNFKVTYLVTYNSITLEEAARREL